MRDNRDELLIGFTIVLAISTILLWLATRSLVRGAERTARQHLRAYVLIDRAAIMNLEDISETAEAHVTIRNFGQTPAYKVVNFTDIALCTYPPQRGINLAISNDRFAAAGKIGSIGPGHEQTAITSTEIGRPFTTAELDGLATGRYVIYVFGEVRYVDAFGKRRFTKYRMMAGGPAGLRGDWLAACEEGNESN